MEYETLGVPVADRGKRLDEQIDLLKALWSDDLVSLDGRFHHLERVALSPRPTKAIPLVFGGGSAAAARRAVRVGDGFFFATPSQEALDLHSTLLQQLDGAGRSNEEFRTIVQVHAARGDEDLERSLEPWQGRGVDDVVIATAQNRMLGAVAESCADIDEHLELLDRAREIVETVLGD